MTLPPDSHICFVSPFIEAYLQPGSTKNVGGAQRQQHLLATRLRDAGHRVSFVVTATDGKRHEQIDGFDIRRAIPGTNSPRRTPEVFFKLLFAIKRIDADVYYVRGNPQLSILVSYCCSLLSLPLLYVVANDSNLELDRLSTHHRLFRHTLPKLAYVDAIRRADRVVTQTSYQRDLLKNVFGIESVTIPNGYTVPESNAVVPATERTHVLWVGTLDPDQKRPERFLQLAEALPDISFRMVGWTGDEAYRERIIERAASLPNLTFEGFVPPDQIDSHYRDAVALVNTSEHEGFPNTFLEAWRFGVPVVSLHHTLDGSLEAEETGYHCGTMDRMIGTVERLWADQTLVADLGLNGRQHLIDNYTLDATAETYSDVFGEMIANSRS